jgi:hypothetical protein
MNADKLFTPRDDELAVTAPLLRLILQPRFPSLSKSWATEAGVEWGALPAQKKRDSGRMWLIQKAQARQVRQERQYHCGDYKDESQDGSSRPR